MTADPNVFAVPVGASFPEALVAGVLDRFGSDPLSLARVTLIVNTTRMQRRVRECFANGGPLLLPQVITLSQLGSGPEFLDIPAATPDLRRRLDIMRLTSALLEQDPSIAPKESAFALADDLSKLLGEMHGEGVAPEALQSIDVQDASGHWARSLKFFDIVRRYSEALGQDATDADLRQRLVTERMVDLWDASPPTSPVILAGSTGSRGATFALLTALAKLENGYVVLPGVDTDLTDAAWKAVTNSPLEDHPQFRFAALCKELGLRPDTLPIWAGVPADVPRNRLMSLALRPAPVTNAWISEGPSLGDLGTATRNMTLIEAPNQRVEATAIALRIREALDAGTRIALITPDRQLTRQVTAALDRWNIEPDDSAGRPLALSPPGRLFRQILRLDSLPITAEALMALLNNPLVASTEGARGPHILATRELEYWLRQKRRAHITPELLDDWIKTQADDRVSGWLEWLIDWMAGLPNLSEVDAPTRLNTLTDLAEKLCAGPDADGSGELWEKKAGEEARAATVDLKAAVLTDDALDARSFIDLVDHVLNAHEVRDPLLPNEDALIWGTLEARVQGASTVILGGLNEGIWPQRPALDAWLNRDMRRQAGLLLPDRQIGLSAHDFQQAVASEHVILTRSVRDAESETVASRWVNRLTGLLSGLPDQGGTAALRRMRTEGQKYVDWAHTLDQPTTCESAATRPSPRPPVSDRPRSLSVTQFETLVRDPYAIYAREILQLRPLNAFSA